MVRQFLKSLKTKIANFFDGIAMYRTVTLALLSLSACSLYLGATGDIPYTFLEQLRALLALLVAGYVVNVAAAAAFRVTANHESAVITALIIFFLFVPPATLEDLLIPVAAVAVAVISKFVVVYRKQHIFNAAAFGAVAISLGGFQDAWWWIAQPELFAPLLFAGVVVVNKIRRWSMVLTFLVVGIVVALGEAVVFDVGEAAAVAYRYVFTGPALFLAFFMLTEPFTTPGTRPHQIAYAAIIAFFVNTSLFVGFVPLSPELALLIGNLVVWPLLLRQKLFFTLIEKHTVADGTYEFVFKKPEGFMYKAGQYLEWMLPHKKTDGRGIRRYFTIASAPAEETVKLGVRVSKEGGSSFKKALVAMKVGDTLIASQLAGDFLLPENESKNYGFIAGGIGITPFMSILKERNAKTGTCPHAALFYANNLYEEIAYREELDTLAKNQPLTLHYALARETREGFISGFLTEEHIAQRTPDFRERLWYLSGPPGMVNAYKKMLRGLGVPKKSIITDYFPGLA